MFWVWKFDLMCQNVGSLPIILLHQFMNFWFFNSYVAIPAAFPTELKEKFSQWKIFFQNSQKTNNQSSVQQRLYFSVNQCVGKSEESKDAVDFKKKFEFLIFGLWIPSTDVSVHNFVNSLSFPNLGMELRGLSHSKFEIFWILLS